MVDKFVMDVKKKNPNAAISRKGSSSSQSNKTSRSKQSSNAKDEEKSSQKKRATSYPLRYIQENKGDGKWQPLEVFDSLPSMYTKERWEELQKQRRNNLKFEYLYWLSRYDPKPSDGHILESIIDYKIEDAKTLLSKSINPLQPLISRLSQTVSELKSQVFQYRGEIATSKKLRSQMYDCIQESDKINFQLNSVSTRVTDLQSSFGKINLSYAKRMSDFDTRLKELDELFHKPSDLMKTMRHETDLLEERISDRILELQSDLNNVRNQHQRDLLDFTSWHKQQRTIAKQFNEGFQKTEMYYNSYAKKIEIFERVMCEFNINIEALKTHALTTDLHFESTLPLQVASVAYEIGLGSITKKQYPKYRKNFKKRLVTLEKNYQDCSDPFNPDYKSVYEKGQYQLPEEYIDPAMVVGKNESPKSSAERKSALRPRNSTQTSDQAKKDRRSRTQRVLGQNSSPQDLQLNDLSNKNRRVTSPSNRNQKARMVSPIGRNINTINTFPSDKNEITRKETTPDSTFQEASKDRIDALPKTIPGQLLETLSQWRPVSSRMTIRELLIAVSKQVTDFLKIPMYEMSSQEFYSLYTDADRKELEIYRPLQSPHNMQATEELPEKEDLASQNEDRSARNMRIEIQPSNNSPAEISNQAQTTKNQALQGQNNQLLPVSSTSADQMLYLSNKLQVLKDAQEDSISGTAEQVDYVPPQLSRLRNFGGFQDPRKIVMEEKLKKAQEVQKQLEKRKLQEQVTNSMESMLGTVDQNERKNDLKFSRLDRSTKEQETLIQRLTLELHKEKQTNSERERRKEVQFDEMNKKMQDALVQLNDIVGLVEESFVEQIKIPQVQLLHTEYSRLRDAELKVFNQLTRVVAKDKEYQQANGGRASKDDGVILAMRKELLSIRNKIKIVSKKIRKYGPLGKIPMGAAMRVYFQDDDSASSVSSGSDEESEENSNSDSSSSNSSKDAKKKQPKKKKVVREVLLRTNELVYQPQFPKVVKMTNVSQAQSNNSIGTFQLTKDDAPISKVPRKKSQPQAKDSRNSKLPLKKDSCSSKLPPRQKQKQKVDVDQLAAKERQDKQNKIELEDVKKEVSKSSINSSQDQAQSISHAQKKNIEHLIQDVDQIPSTQEDFPASDDTKIDSQKPDSIYLKPEKSAKKPHKRPSVIMEAAIEKYSSMAERIESKHKSGSRSNSLDQNVTSVEKESPYEKETSDDQSQQKLKQIRNFAQTMSYNCKKINQKPKPPLPQKKFRDVEIQTDPVEFGEVELDVDSEDDTDKSKMVNQLLKKDEGTDAPKFLILNVLPSRPSEEFFTKRDKYVKNLYLKRFKTPSTRIENIVGQIRCENARKDIEEPTVDIKSFKDKYALLLGDEPNQDIIRITKQNEMNSKMYDAYDQLQNNLISKNTLIEKISNIQEHETKQNMPAQMPAEMPAQMPAQRPIQRPVLNLNIPPKPDHNRSKTEAVNEPSSPLQSPLVIPKKLDQSSLNTATASVESHRSRNIHKTRKKKKNTLLKEARTPLSNSSKYLNGYRKRSTRKIPNFKKSDQVILQIHKQNSEKSNNTKVESPQSQKESSQQQYLKNRKTEQVNGEKFSKRLDDPSNAGGEISLNYTSDDKEESEEDDDFVTIQEFNDYKIKVSKEQEEMKKLYNQAINKNMDLVSRLDKVDWKLINQVEKKLTDVLSEFQLSVDGLMITIEADFKKWRIQNTELNAKYETITETLKNMKKITDCLRDEIFSDSNDSWKFQENVTHFFNLQVGLAKADEVDKHGISLVGQSNTKDMLKQQFTKQEAVLGLNSSCRQCQCQTIPERTAMLQNLKLACLAYKPSQVFVPGSWKTAQTRAVVVDRQQELSAALGEISKERLVRMHQFKLNLQHIDELARNSSPQGTILQNSPTRFIQTSHEKIFEGLNFTYDPLTSKSPIQEKQEGRIQNMNITITNNIGDLRMISSSTSSPITANVSKDEPHIVPKNLETSNTKLNISGKSTMLKRPIIKGKIAGRALYKKTNLNHTSSNFSHIVQQQKAIRERSFTGNKVSHQSAANIGLQLPSTSKIENLNYKLSLGSSENRKVTVFNKTATQFNQKIPGVSPNDSNLSSKNIKNNAISCDGSLTERALPSSGKINCIHRRQLKNIQQSPNMSPSNLNMKIEQNFSKCNSKTLEIEQSKRSLPRIPRLDKTQFDVLEQRNLSMPEFDPKIPLNQLSQVVTEPWPTTTHQLSSINIRTPRGIGPSHNEDNNDPETVRKPSSFDRDGFMNTNASDTCEYEDRQQRQIQTSDSMGGYGNIKVEVRNSKIFGPGSSRQITNQEIRAARRNVVPNTARNNNDRLTQ